MPPHAPPPRRRGAALLLCAAFLAEAGCEALEEPPDDSLRGAGSIEIPSADLQFRPAPAAPEAPALAEPGP